MTERFKLHPAVILGWIFLIAATYWITKSLAYSSAAVLVVVVVYVAVRTVQERRISLELENFCRTFFGKDNLQEQATVFDKMWFGKEEHVVGIVYSDEGIGIFISSKLNGVLRWEDVQLHTVDSTQGLVRIRTDSLKNDYDGPNELRLPWRDELLKFVPESLR